MGRQWDLMCGLSELESSLKTPFRSGIDPPVATFAGAVLPVVKMPSEGSENNIKVPSCSGPACGCSPSCDCKPECHCEGPSEGSENSIKAEREGIHPKLKKS